MIDWHNCTVAAHQRSARQRRASKTELIKDARTFEGLFRLYQTDEKVYLEILPDQFEKVFIVSLTCESGIGERGFYAARMCAHLPIVFRKQAKNVQLVARPDSFRLYQVTRLDSADLAFNVSRRTVWDQSRQKTVALLQTCQFELLITGRLGHPLQLTGSA